MSLLAEHFEALKRDPTSESAAALVRDGARHDGALLELAEAFADRGQQLARRGLSDRAVNAYVEAALVYEEDLEDLDAAAKLYSKVLDLEGNHRRALFALGLLLYDLGRFRDLVELYRQRLERSTDEGERTTLFLYVAEILSEKLGDDSGAFEAALSASRLAPRNLRIISRLERLGERTGRLSEVAVAIGDLAMNQEDPRVRAALSLRLAELHMGPLEDKERALAYFRAAILDDGGSPEILSEVQDVFRERARFDELASLLEDVARDRRVDPQRVRLERELARIYEYELGDKRRALHALTRAVKSATDDRDLLEEILRLGTALKDKATVAAAFEEAIERSHNALLKTYWRLKLSHLS